MIKRRWNIHKLRIAAIEKLQFIVHIKVYRNERKNFNPIHFFCYEKLLVFHTKGVRGICPLQANFFKFLLRTNLERVVPVDVHRQCLLFRPVS